MKVVCLILGPMLASQTFHMLFGFWHPYTSFIFTENGYIMGYDWSPLPKRNIYGSTYPPVDFKHCL